MSPTTWERIFFDLRSVMQRHGALFAHAGKILLVFLLVSIALESFVFNINHWTSLNNSELDMTSELGLQQNADGEYLLTEANHVIEFSDLDVHLRNVKVDLSEEQSAKLIQAKIQFTDEAHETYFDTTEYSVGVPLRNIATTNEDSEYIKLTTVGVSNNLRLELTQEDNQYPVLVDGVYLNSVIPFQFSFARCAFVYLVLILVYLFRPKSKVYSIYIGSFPRLSKCFVMAFVSFEIVLISLFLFFGSNSVGVATSFYNWGSWNGHSLVNTFETGGDNAQQYAMLAQAIADDGQLYLEVDPPDWLVEMDNPYDKGARAELQKETGESYLWDVVYYDGHYYVYFGVVPVLIFYLPFYLLTGLSFPTAIGVLISAIAFVLGCTVLLDRFARYHFRRVSLGLYLLLQLPLIFCNGSLYLIKHPTFYSLPIMLALAFSAWGLYLWMRGRESEKNSCFCYVLGSLCMALVLGCRPQLLVLSFVAFPLFWRRYITQRFICTKRGALEFICLIAPYLVVGLGIMWYNAARFGSPFDFGSAYNLTTNDMTQRGWTFARLMPALFAFFIQTPNTIGTFPYLQACDFSTTYMGQTIREVTFGGLLMTVPVLWVLFLGLKAGRLRSATRNNRTTLGVLIVLVASAVVVALADAEMAGILQRYFADFSFMLLLAAILVAFVFNENIKHEGDLYQIAKSCLFVMVGISLLYQLCLCFAEETGWYSSVYPWAYQSIVSLFQFWA